MIRVLIADDSATARALLVALISAQPDMTVAGEAHTGRDAVEMSARLAPDVITMDLHMPELDGFQATQEIMTRAPRPIIIVSASATRDDVELSLEATRAGALLVLPRPSGPSIAPLAADQRHLLNMIRAMAQVKVVRRHTVGAPGSRELSFRPAVRTMPSGSRSRVVAIGASTGGPAALLAILAELPRTLTVPVLVVQHIAHGFTAGLAHWLRGGTALTVRVAAYGEPANPGTVYIAPDDQHLGLQLSPGGTMRVMLERSPPIGSFRPSATHLFRSVGAAMGGSALGVILTGMGEDGVAGLRDLHAAGGRVIAQDEGTSVIYGMPREAVRAGVVHEVLPLPDIAAHILELTS